MNYILLYSIASLIVVGTLSTILVVGKPRQPITPKVAAGTVAVSLYQLAALLYLGFQV